MMRTCSFESCDSLVEGNTDYCASHGHQMRKAMREAAKVRVVTPVKKVSKKMLKDIQDYGVLRRKYLSEHDVCEAQLPVCDYVSVEVHHRAKRGRNLLDASTFMAVCRACHDYIEFTMSAEERRERGLLITKNDTV